MRFVAAIFCVFMAVRISAADGAVDTRLDSCIGYYQDGDYQKAVDSLKALLPLISDKRDEAEAYKYLGFSYVMLDMINKAKDFFKVALEKFPQMTIDTLEVPPNITIVFKQTMLERRMAKGDLIDKKRQRPIVLISVLGTSGVVLGTAGGWFLFQGKKDRDAYNALGPDAAETRFAELWNSQKRKTIIGAVAAGTACTAGGIALYLALRKSPKPAPSTRLLIGADRVAVALDF